LKQILSDITGEDIEISQNKDLAKTLKDLGFKKDEIIKLLAEDLEDDSVKPEEKKKIEELLQE
jgi:Holliday junction resolvasome RuvABC DNA-binding subunit